MEGSDLKSCIVASHQGALQMVWSLGPLRDVFDCLGTVPEIVQCRQTIHSHKTTNPKFRFLEWIQILDNVCRVPPFRSEKEQQLKSLDLKSLMGHIGGAQGNWVVEEGLKLFAHPLSSTTTNLRAAGTFLSVDKKLQQIRFDHRFLSLRPPDEPPSPLHKTASPTRCNPPAPSPPGEEFASEEFCRSIRKQGWMEAELLMLMPSLS